MSKAILFDLDGTLLDTIEDLADAMNSVLKNKGFPEHSSEKYKYFVGDGLEKLVNRVLPENRKEPNTIKECMDNMSDAYAKNWQKNTKPYPGIIDLLSSLSEKQIPLTILSNKPDHFTQKMVEYYFDKWEFKKIMGAQATLPHKPDPAGAISIAKELNIQPEDFVYLGDTATDMQTATAAGMYPIGVLWGFRTAEELTKNGAKVLIETPEQALQYIQFYT